MDADHPRPDVGVYVIPGEEELLLSSRYSKTRQYREDHHHHLQQRAAQSTDFRLDRTTHHGRARRHPPRRPGVDWDSLLVSFGAGGFVVIL